ncbi:hypothetical protein AB2L27_07025 [Kineococcus sp. LSe6-4]|uniref:Uncharacterized protein n=1 Tax=Kineococcus halophytocola TaxID=3234027 RepID=A0ABV4GZM1_9ACTN
MRRSAWAVRIALLVVLVPLLASVVVTAGIVSADDVVRSTGDLPATTPLLWRDRWQAVLLFGPQFSDPSLPSLTALGCLALALVTSGPRVAPPVRELRAALPPVAVAGATWAAATVAVTVWFQLSASRADEDPASGFRLVGQPSLGWPGGLLGVSETVLCVGVAVAVTLWCRRARSSERDARTGVRAG